MKNVVLYDIDGNLQTTDDQINANGNISFNSKFDLGFKIENFEMKNLTFKNITTDKVNVTVTSPKMFLNMHKSYKILHHDFKSFVIATIPTVPPIPIIVTPKLDVELDVYVSSSSLITATLTQNADLTLGVSYSDNSWIPISEFNNYFNFQKPQFPEKADLSIVPSQKLSLWLYDRVGGIYGKLSEYATISSENSNWQVYAGLWGDVGVDMGIFKKFIPSYSKRVLQYDKLVYNEINTNTIPFADFSVNPTQGTTYTNFQFDASLSSDNEDTLENLLFRWDWDDEYSSADDEIYDTEYSSNPISSHVYTSPGKYSVRLQAKDRGGMTNYVVKFNVVTVN